MGKLKLIFLFVLFNKVLFSQNHTIQTFTIPKETSGIVTFCKADVFDLYGVEEIIPIKIYYADSNSISTNNTICLNIMDGYSVISRLPCNIRIRSEERTKHLYYLDSNKKILPDNIIIWEVKKKRQY